MTIRPFIKWLLFATLATIFAARVGLCADINAQAICRINNGDSAGSGCLVGVDESTGLVVTCHHLFTDGNFGPVVTFPNGQRLPAQIVADDPTHDVTALAIARPNVQPVPLANYRPDKGEKLASAGYGSNSVLAVNYGMVDKHADMGDGTYASIRLTGTVRSGDSGGPIFNANGELCAIIWGGNPEGVYGTGSHVVNVALAQCRGGVCQPYRIVQQPNQWRPAPGAPSYQQPPLVQVPPQPKTQAPPQPAGKSCQCTGEGACKCDPSSACKCDLGKFEPRLIKIEAALAAGTLKGEKGDPGQKGDPGTVDPAALQAAVNAAVAKAVQNIDGNTLAAKLPPLKVQVWNADANPKQMTDEIEVPIGGTLPLENKSIKRK